MEILKIRRVNPIRTIDLDSFRKWVIKHDPPHIVDSLPDIVECNCKGEVIWSLRKSIL